MSVPRPPPVSSNALASSSSRLLASLSSIHLPRHCGVWCDNRFGAAPDVSVNSHVQRSPRPTSDTALQPTGSPNTRHGSMTDESSTVPGSPLGVLLHQGQKSPNRSIVALTERPCDQRLDEARLSRRPRSRVVRHRLGWPRPNRLSVASAARAIASPVVTAACSAPSAAVTSPDVVGGVRVAVFASAKVGVGGDPFLVDRRGIERRSHRGGDTADDAIPDHLLVVELDNRGPESNHVDDVETPIGLHERHRTIMIVWVHEPESVHGRTSSPRRTGLDQRPRSSAAEQLHTWLAAPGPHHQSVSIRQAVAEVPANGQQDHVRREPVAGERNGDRSAVAIHHGTPLPSPDQSTQQRPPNTVLSQEQADSGVADPAPGSTLANAVGPVSPSGGFLPRIAPVRRL